MTAPDPITAEERAERWADLFGAAPDMTAQAMFGDDHPTVLLARAEAAEKREADLRQRIEALAEELARDADAEWDKHNEYADIGDIPLADGHGEAAEALEDASRRLRTLLVTPEAGEEGQG